MDHNPDDKLERDQYALKLGTESAIDKIIRTGYKRLNLMNFFTAGQKEVRAWTIREGTKAPQAAGQVHTDFETGFICAEVMKYNDLIKYKTIQNMKTAGLYHKHGKAYVF
jgi:obg-like ATPase 1